MFSLGCAYGLAKTVFILPTPPKGEYLVAPNGHLNQPSVTDIIAQDGNHWRKILTIMAKLTAAKMDWREYRDTRLVQESECILFQMPEYFDQDKIYYVCGGQMQSALKEIRDFIQVDDKGLLKVDQNLILCPYPDYRQFPNKLIDLNLAYLNQVLENK